MIGPPSQARAEDDAQVPVSCVIFVVMSVYVWQRQGHRFVAVLYRLRGPVPGAPEHPSYIKLHTCHQLPGKVRSRWTLRSWPFVCIVL